MKRSDLTESQGDQIIPTGSEQDSGSSPVLPSGQTGQILPASSAAADALPAILASASDRTKEHIAEFFFANIRNLNTRRAYQRQVRQFLTFCEERFGLAELKEIRPLHVAAYIETETKVHEPQTVKQQLAAIRMLFDWLVVRQEIPMNPASAARGPRYSLKKGKTPVLSRAEAKQLLDSIPVQERNEDSSDGSPLVVGLRDRALIALMVSRSPGSGRSSRWRSRTTTPTGSAGGCGCMRKTARSMRC